MTDDDTQVEMGLFAQEVISHPLWKSITANFETAMCQQILGTKPDHTRARESIYQTFQGAMTFIGFLEMQVAAASKIIEERAIQDTDAQDEETIADDDYQ